MNFYMAKETSLFDKFKETGKHGIIFGIGSTLRSAIGFILIPIYTTHLTVSDYGVLGLILITSEILIAIFGLSFIAGLFRSYYDYDDEETRREVISTAFFLMVITCSILFIFGLLFSSYLSLLIFGTTSYELYLFIVIIISVFTILNQIPFAIFRARKYSVQYVILQTSFFIIGISLIIYLVTIRNWGILGALVGQLVMAMVSFFCLYAFIRKDIAFKFSRFEARKIMYFGIPLVPSYLSNFIFNSSDRYILNYYSTLQEVGLYTLGYQFGMVMMILFVNPMGLIWRPMSLSVKDHSNARDFYSRALTYTIFIGSFLFLGISLLSKEVIQIFTNREYWDAYCVVPIIALTYLIFSPRPIFGVAFDIKRRTEIMALCAIVGAITNLILNFILIPEYGMRGAAYATLISFAIMLIIAYHYSQKLMKLYYEWHRILKVCVVASLIFAIGFFVVIDNLYASIVFKIGVILTFPLVLYLMRFYTKEEIGRITQIPGYILIKLKLKQASKGM